jgi:hypothetical protein
MHGSLNVKEVMVHELLTASTKKGNGGEVTLIPENGGYYSYLGGTITKDARCMSKLNPGLPWQKKNRHSTGRRICSPANWTSV